ncbi:MAG: amidotransferase 1, exosortase A system-associated [Alphaproteobacteria bacterium]|nr:amidotransferase 1, exosortase A system-associated [Alphaproteobacteria bacterium]
MNAPMQQDMSLARLDSVTRLRLHLGPLVAVAFLSIYAKSVCPFIDSVPFVKVSTVLLILAAGHLIMRELLFFVSPHPIGRESAARHGFHLSVIGWVSMGGAAMMAHAIVYPGFPVSSHLKLLSGYWALGAGILAQVEFVILESHFRNFRHEAPKERGERIANRLMEGFTMISVVPVLVMVLMAARMEFEGQHDHGLSIEIGFLGFCFVVSALFMSWGYGNTLREDCNRIVSSLDDVREGRFSAVKLDSSRLDELGLVAAGINEMASGLVLREQIRDAFGRFVDPAVATQVINAFHPGHEGRVHLEGRRVEVTVLMADLRGFTPLTEAMDPEALTRLLNGYFAEMVAAVQAHGGMVDKFIGDAMMAVFGLGMDTDHTLAAVRCAMEMRTRLVQFNLGQSETGKLANGIGLHVGEVVAGLIGSPDRLEFTVIGSAVNVAARLEAQARPPLPPILMSAAAAERLAGRLDLVSTGAISLKGVSGAVGTFAPAGIVPDAYTPLAHPLSTSVAPSGVAKKRAAARTCSGPCPEPPLLFKKEDGLGAIAPDGVRGDSPDLPPNVGNEPMCGLVGMFDTLGRREMDEALLRRMNDKLVHRGPDGGGLHVGPGIGLGHRRLAIIDIGGGHQPMYNEDNTVAVVFKGEIYNFQPLAHELETLGHVFRSRCDTEVILHAWEQWGQDSVKRFHGMFAFALWDEPKQTLFLARDHLGKKPLYWTRLADGMAVFGSELKAVMEHRAVPKDLDPHAVEDFFAYGYIPDPRSIFGAVRKLPPAHRLVWRRGQPAPVVDAYWDLEFGAAPVSDLDDATDQLLTRLREATRSRLLSDVPLGAFLSGGVDSSGIVAMMAELSGEVAVKTFSICFDDQQYDESVYSSRIARRYGTDHHVQTVNPDDCAQIDRLAGIYDEPFGDSSALPTLQVCALARSGVTVALSGDGGDEVLAGYRRYAMHLHGERVRRALPLSLRRPVFGLLGRIYPKADWAPRWMRARTTFQELALDSTRAYFQMVTALNDEQRTRLFTPAFRRQLQGYHAFNVLRDHMERADTDDALARIQYADLKTWLPGSILVKVDRASMANSLEVRAPLLDVGLLEWSTRLTPETKVRGNQGKLVLKRALEPYVDHDILYRPKRGFSMPLARWFRGPLRARVGELANSSRLADSRIFDMDEVGRMVRLHQSARSDQSVGLWLLLMFDAFLKTGA